jgi:hypothetical protein
LGDPLKGNLLLFYKPLHLEAQQVSTRIEVRRHQGPPVPGVHRAGIFALFLLPGGRSRRFIPELDSAASEEAEGSMGLGSVEEEVALEEEGEVP